jgi:hypothetical protein
MASSAPTPSRWRSVPGALLAAAAAAFWWRRAPSAWTLALVALTGALVLAALMLPRVYAPVQAALERAASLLARVSTLLLLGLVFVFVFIPGRLVLALGRRDPLHRRPDPGRTTYWLTADTPAEADRFRHQF